MKELIKYFSKLKDDIEIMKKQHFKLIDDYKKLVKKIHNLEIQKLTLEIDIKYLDKKLKKLKKLKKEKRKYD